MPATAHQPEAEDEHTPLAPVVSLVGRRDAKPSVVDELAALEQMSEDQLAQDAFRHWSKVFKDAGIDFGDAATVATVAVVAKEFERITSGLLVFREGAPEQNLPPNPNAGVDFTSAMQMTGMFHDLAKAAQAAAKEAANTKH